MKNFKPSNLDDFNRDQPYKYNPPGASSSTYAFILALGESRDGLQSELCKQRVKYPNKKRILDIINLHLSSTTEEDESFQSQKLDARKEKGKAANMERIMQKVGPHFA